MYKDSESRFCNPPDQSILLHCSKVCKLGAVETATVSATLKVDLMGQLAMDSVAIFNAGDEESHSANPYTEYFLAKRVDMHSRP